MYFQQFYLACLSHASYMMGSGGIAAVVDPQRDVEIYLDEARRHELKIEHVIETHLHADFVSGHRELAARTGAKIYLGAAAGATFPHIGVRDGDELRFGRCRLEFLETPGHSLDSVSILVADLDRSEKPFAVLTGDTLFIGDVGRPDLARDRSTQEMAAMLYESMQKLLRLPDAVEVYPAHGAGSLCGKQMSSERRSTIGKERLTNYALRAANREEFIRLITADLPERPEYFATDHEINRLGAPALAELPPLAPLTPAEALARQQDGAVVLDTRPAVQFAAAHIPGSIHIALAGQYASWAGTLIGLGASIILLAEDEQRLIESRVRLARVGIERVIGYVADGIAGWTRSGLPVEQIPQITAAELHRMLVEEPERVQVVDVRRPSEYEAGRIRGARLMPLYKLNAMLDSLDREKPVAVHCQSGYRSSIAASLLRRAGFPYVMNVTGGFDAWRTSNLPSEQAAG